MKKEQEKFINRLEQEGLEVTREDNYYTVEDIEGHITTVDFKENAVVVTNNEGTEISTQLKHTNKAYYEVLDALDYDFE